MTPQFIFLSVCEAADCEKMVLVLQELFDGLKPAKSQGISISHIDSKRVLDAWLDENKLGDILKQLHMAQVQCEVGTRAKKSLIDKLRGRWAVMQTSGSYTLQSNSAQDERHPSSPDKAIAMISKPKPHAADAAHATEAHNSEEHLVTQVFEKLMLCQAQVPGNCNKVADGRPEAGSCQSDCSVDESCEMDSFPCLLPGLLC